ncbi:MAG: flagellar export protein FliJ [Proteobacteria bacterium]|nr:flagellar export protein FliJ [Pseudomonadota bacterium]
MTMNDLEPLKALLGQAERERDAAIAEHRRTQVAHEAAQAQAEQLLSYRRDYEQRWSTRFQRAAEIEVMRSYQGFMERLTLAVESQERAVEHAVLVVERAAASLREHELRCASVRRLIERRMHDWRAGVERREQRMLDELAARSAAHRAGLANRAF